MWHQARHLPPEGRCGSSPADVATGTRRERGKAWRPCRSPPRCAGSGRMSDAAAGGLRKHAPSAAGRPLRRLRATSRLVRLRPFIREQVGNPGARPDGIRAPRIKLSKRCAATERMALVHSAGPSILGQGLCAGAGPSMGRIYGGAGILVSQPFRHGGRARLHWLVQLQDAPPAWHPPRRRLPAVPGVSRRPRRISTRDVEGEARSPGHSPPGNGHRETLPGSDFAVRIPVSLRFLVPDLAFLQLTGAVSGAGDRPNSEQPA